MTNPFSPFSTYSTPLPRAIPHATNSDAIVKSILALESANYGHWAFNTDSWSTAVFRVSENQPTVDLQHQAKWTTSPSPYTGPLQASHFSSVPIPTDAYPSPGDINIAIHQPSTDKIWEFGGLTRDNATGKWAAAYGGRIDDVSRNTNGQHIIIPGGEALGVSASGLAILATLVRLEEMHAGQINHVLGIGLPTGGRNVPSWPATRTDGSQSSVDYPAQGQRLRLDPTINLGQIPGITPGEVIIGAALQNYGGIVIDTAGVCSIYGEHSHGDQIFNQLLPGDNAHLPNIPWDRLVVAPVDWGRV